MKKQKNKLVKEAGEFTFAVILILSVIYSVGLLSGMAIDQDIVEGDFSGTFDDTVYGVDHIELAESKITGNYTSRIFDATAEAQWQNISWNVQQTTIYEIYAVDSKADVWKSTDSGVSWSLVKDDYNGDIGNGASSMTTDGTYLFILHNQDVWRSADSGISWVLVSDDFNEVISSSAGQFITYNGSALFIVDGLEDVYKSTNSGVDWTRTVDDFNGGNGNSKGFIADSNGVLWQVDGQADVWNSTDSGVTWNLVKNDYNNGEGNSPLFLLIDDSDYLYIIESDDDVWKSTDMGITWSKVNDDYNGEANNLQTAVVSNNNLFINEGDEDVWMSTDEAVTWNKQVVNFNGDNGNAKGMAGLSTTTDITFLARSCNLTDCSDASFVSVSSGNISFTGQYFQYKALFTSPTTAESPYLYNISIGYDLTDSESPVVTLSLPADSYTDTVEGSVNVTFECNITDDSALANISLYITDLNNENFAANQTTSISGTSDSKQWILELAVGSYTWNCLAYDNAGKSDWANTNRTIDLYGISVQQVNVTSIELNENTYCASNNIYIIANISEQENVTTVTAEFNNGTTSETDDYTISLSTTDETNLSWSAVWQLPNNANNGTWNVTVTIYNNSAELGQNNTSLTIVNDGPGYVQVYAPATANTNENITATVEIKNNNTQCPLNFSVEYWLADLDNAINYDSTTETIEVQKNSSINISATRTVPDIAKTYAFIALITWLNDSDYSYDSFTASSVSTTVATTSVTTTTTGGGGSSGVTTTSIEETSTSEETTTKELTSTTSVTTEETIGEVNNLSAENEPFDITGLFVELSELSIYQLVALAFLIIVVIVAILRKKIPFVKTYF